MSQKDKVQSAAAAAAQAPSAAPTPKVGCGSGKPDTDCGSDCQKCTPDQSQFPIKEKGRLRDIAENTRHTTGYAPGSPQNPDYFKKTVTIFNEVAKQLHINVLWIHAMAGAEGGWLDVENDWLHNPYGVTTRTGPNLGFTCLEQASAYWICKYGDDLRDSKTVADFIAVIRRRYHTVKAEYQSPAGFQPKIDTVTRRLAANGLKTKALKDGTVILVPLSEKDEDEAKPKGGK